MKETPEDYVISITDPVSGNAFDFSIDEDANLSLSARLIRKRSRLTKSSREKFKRVMDLRKEHEVEKLDKKISELAAEVQSLSKREDETIEEFEERSNEVIDKFKELKDEYPDEIVDLQNQSAKLLNRSEDIGLKICTMILKPLKEIPPEYTTKQEFIEDILIDDTAINEVIDFFLSVYTSFMNLDMEPESTVKVRKTQTNE